MTETTNVRLERIEKLLHQLRYEIERGMLEREIGEEMTFRFVVPPLPEDPGWRCVLPIQHPTVLSA